ncbi:MAG: hypothetical protein Q8P67_14565, partial [archaeon]|nr:hypothetical protein [archaeon]
MVMAVVVMAMVAGGFAAAEEKEELDEEEPASNGGWVAREKHLTELLRQQGELLEKMRKTETGKKLIREMEKQKLLGENTGKPIDFEALLAKRLAESGSSRDDDAPRDRVELRKRADRADRFADWKNSRDVDELSDRIQELRSKIHSKKWQN